MKETITSTRFLILALIIICATVLCAVGKYSAEAWGSLVGGIAVGFGAAIVSAKTAANAAKAAIKVLVPVALIGSLLSGCTWQQATKTSADVAGSLVTTSRAGGDPLWLAKCNAAKEACITARDAECKPLSACQADQHAFNEVLIGISTARAGAYSAILSGNKAKADGWTAALKVASDKVQATLRALGVLP